MPSSKSRSVVPVVKSNNKYSASTGIFIFAVIFGLVIVALIVSGLFDVINWKINILKKFIIKFIIS